MKIAMAQSSIIYENKKANYEKAEVTVQKAKEKGSDLIIFPEMSFTGFSMNTDKTKEKDESLTFVKDLAVKNQIAIGFGYTKDAGKLCQNRYAVLGSDGKVLCDYCKIHPFSYSGENRKFSSGKDVVFFDYGGFRFSVFLCYDVRFPEIFSYAGNYADIILVPANFPLNRINQFETLILARAIETQCYVLGVNCTGIQGDTVYNGHSLAVSPKGEIIAKSGEKEELLFAHIHEKTGNFKKKFPVKADRKNSFYISLLEEMM